jgi:hypothetical protein
VSSLTLDAILRSSKDLPGNSQKPAGQAKRACLHRAGPRVTQAEKSSGGGEVAQTMYTHVSKCKNDKIKNNKKNRKKK